MTSGDAPRVVIIDSGYSAYDYEREVLEAAGYRLDIFDGDRHDREGRIALARGAAGIMVRWTVIDDAFLDALPGLRAIARYGVGYDNIDIPACTRRGIPVTIVQGYANHSVSNHALSLIFACIRALPLGQAFLRSRYNHPPREDVRDPHRMTLGILGLGRIGGTLCQKAKPLFERVLACDPYIPPARFEDLGAVPVSFPELLAESDVISIHCNLTPETAGLFNADAFARMHRRPILVNTARGPIVDEDALFAALESDRVHSAGLDVFQDEPPLSNRDRLLAHPRVIATGHYAWYSEDANAQLQIRTAQNMLALLSGSFPDDCLNAPTASAR
jgi:D-3-phosphoglycerate dehydrogenase